MEIILELLKELFNSLSPAMFLVVLCVIFVSTLFTLKFVLNSVKKRSGFLSFIFKTDNDEQNDLNFTEINSVKQLLAELIKDYPEKTKTIIETVVARLDEHNESNELKYQQMINELYSIFNNIDTIIKETAEVNAKNALRIQEELNKNNNAVLSTFETSIKNNLLEINKISALCDRLNEHVKTSLSDIRESNKNLSRDIFDLRRDIALIERSIQTQLSAVTAITLRQ